MLRRLPPAVHQCFWLCVVAITWMAAPACSAVQFTASSRNVNCRAWRRNSVQAVTVAPDVGTLYLGTRCNVAQVNITFLCYPGAAIHLDQWNMLGGFVRIAGPPESPWSVHNVTVLVTSSTIAACGGPAVGIELGYGWANATTSLFTVSNVTLAAAQSTLSSVTSDTAAIVLGCTCVGSHNVSVTSATFLAINSTVTATAVGSRAAAAVVGCAIFQGVSIRVDHSVFSLSNTTAKTSTTGEVDSAVSAIGGVAVGNATAVAFDTCTHWSSWSSVSSSCIVGTRAVLNAYAISTVVGVAVSNTAVVIMTNSTLYLVWSSASSFCSVVGQSALSAYATSSVGGVATGAGGVTIINSALYLSNTSAVSNSSVNSQGTRTYSSSSVGGLAAGYITSFTLSNVLQYVTWTNASSNANGGEYVASSIGGVSVGSVASLTTISHTTKYLLKATATSSSSSGTTSTNAFAASSVGGIAVSNAFILSTQNITQCLSWTDSTSKSSNAAGAAVSSVGGVAVGITDSLLMTTAKQMVSWTTAKVVSSSTGNLSSASAVTSVGGTAVGLAFDNSLITNVTQSLSWTTASSSSRAFSSTSAFSASCAGGIALSSTNGLTVHDTLQYVSRSNADSHSSATGTTLGCGVGSVGGVVVGKSPLKASNSSQYFAWSNASGDGSSNTYSAFAIGSVAGASNSLVLLSNSQLSMSRILACAGGPLSFTTAACMGVVPKNGTGCCSNVSTTTVASMPSPPADVVLEPPSINPPVAINEQLWLNGTPKPITPSATRGTSSSTPSRTSSWLSVTNTVTQHTPPLRVKKRSRTPTATPSHTSRDTSTLPLPPTTAGAAAVGIVPAAAIEGNQGFLSSTTALASTITGPGAALQASRAMTVVVLSQCNSDPDARVPFPLSVWPGFAIDSSRHAAYLRGAVVAGLASVTLFVCVGFFIGVVVKAQHNGSSLLNAVSMIKYPGWLTVAIGLTVDGVVASGLGAALWGDAGVLDRVVGGLALLYIVVAFAFTFGVSYHVSNNVASMEPLIPDGPNTFCSRVDRVVRGNEQWVPKAEWTSSTRSTAEPPAVVFRAVGSVFNKYRHPRRWYYAFDLALTVAVSCVKGTMPSSRSSCTIAIIVVSIVCAASLITAVAWKPYIAPAKQWLLIATSALTFAAVSFVLIGFLAAQDSLVSVGQIVAMLAGYAALGNVFVGVYREASELRDRFRKNRNVTVAFFVTDAPYAEMQESLQPRTVVATLPSPEAAPPLLQLDETLLSSLLHNTAPATTTGDTSSSCDDKFRLVNGSFTRPREGQARHDELEQLLGHAAVTPPQRAVRSTAVPEDLNALL